MVLFLFTPIFFITVRSGRWSCDMEGVEVRKKLRCFYLIIYSNYASQIILNTQCGLHYSTYDWTAFLSVFMWKYWGVYTFLARVNCRSKCLQRPWWAQGYPRKKIDEKTSDNPLKTSEKRYVQFNLNSAPRFIKKTLVSEKQPQKKNNNNQVAQIYIPLMEPQTLLMTWKILWNH